MALYCDIDIFIFVAEETDEIPVTGKAVDELT